MQRWDLYWFHWVQTLRHEQNGLEGLVLLQCHILMHALAHSLKLLKGKFSVYVLYSVMHVSVCKLLVCMLVRIRSKSYATFVPFIMESSEMTYHHSHDYVDGATCSKYT